MVCLERGIGLFSVQSHDCMLDGIGDFFNVVYWSIIFETIPFNFVEMIQYSFHGGKSIDQIILNFLRRPEYLVPQDVVATGGKCQILRWVNEHFEGFEREGKRAIGTGAGTRTYY
ncbi:hypothetical protein ACOSQ2_022927 [Xanthoceras sorbifolium]